MKIQSCKKKGRRLCLEVREMILECFKLFIHEDDVRVNPASVPGEDIWLSSSARAMVPFAIECKNQERLNIWGAIQQSKKYAKDGRVPIVVFSRNKEPQPYAIISFRDLIYLINKQHEK